MIRIKWIKDGKKSGSIDTHQICKLIICAVTILILFFWKCKLAAFLSGELILPSEVKYDIGGFFIGMMVFVTPGAVITVICAIGEVIDGKKSGSINTRKIYKIITLIVAVVITTLFFDIILCPLAFSNL